ncbi:MAG TPA: hypothetical protein DIU37_00955, partial [Opitutae bacterium]|nr:hypothetical protein [Opitutae bacterium]
FFKKKKLHLVKAAKEFTEKYLKINNCPTESNLSISDCKKKIAEKNINKNIYHCTRYGLGKFFSFYRLTTGLFTILSL